MRLWGVVLLKATLLALGLLRGHLNICLYLMKRPATPFVKIGMEVMKIAQRRWGSLPTRLSLADHRHNGMDVSCSRRGEDCGHYFDDRLSRWAIPPIAVVGSVEICIWFSTARCPRAIFWPSPFLYTCREYLRRHLYFRIDEPRARSATI